MAKMRVAIVTFACVAAIGLSGPVQADDAKTLCAQEAYAMGLRYQQSAEVEALQRQAYALATLRLDQAVAKHGPDAKLAIITDLDETAIDNSPLLVRDMQACHDYTTWDTWKAWERDGNPRLIPGAGDFLAHADRQGVRIFYVSDRYDENKASTVATLKKLGLPQVEERSVLLLGPPKQDRRAAVAADFTVIMLLGDQLADFSEAFGSKVPLREQHDLVGKNAASFGTDWIVLPNSTYGTWRKAKLNAWDAPLKADLLKP